MATLEDLDVCDATDLPWMPLLYQAGYLTIKEVAWQLTEDGDKLPVMTLGIPNARMQPERASARGFADAVVETEKGVWIFEFKFNRSAASAIRQIRDRGYAEPYLPRPITLVGIKFDPKIRNIALPKFEAL